MRITTTAFLPATVQFYRLQCGPSPLKDDSGHCSTVEAASFDTVSNIQVYAHFTSQVNRLLVHTYAHTVYKSVKIHQKRVVNEADVSPHSL